MYPRPPLKKMLFPVQLVAEIVAFFFGGVRNLSNFFLGGNAKMQRKILRWQESTHPAAGPETNYFLSNEMSDEEIVQR